MEKHPDYWKVKSAFLESQLIEEQAKAAALAARAKFRETMAASGLDPLALYELDDAAETITLKPTP